MIFQNFFRCFQHSGGVGSFSECNVLYIMLSSLKNDSDETLFLELALRGYDLTKLRDEQTTGEIIKIG